MPCISCKCLLERSGIIKLVWGSQVGFVRVLEQKDMIALITAELDSEAIISLASTSHASPTAEKNEVYEPTKGEKALMASRSPVQNTDCINLELNCHQKSS